MLVYRAQSGDTLELVARRFEVSLTGIIAEVNLPPAEKFIKPGTLLLIPNRLNNQTTPGEQSIPDSEFVYSPSTIGFDTAEYVSNARGYLSTYKESLSSDLITGTGAVERIALENSLNPRLVLAIIEYESHWVLGQPTNLAQDEYPLGHVDYHKKGLFRQLMWASGMLSDGYYRWRSGDLTELTFKDGAKLRLNPTLNAGTAAIQYYFSLEHSRAEWEQAVAPTGFAALYEKMYGDPWERAKAVEPLLPAGISQPELSLPFQPRKVWSFSGGPHSVWEEEGALAALDFAPSAEITGCAKSDLWILAPAAGTVVRTAKGVVMLDLDGDGHEQTGWVLLFLHVEQASSVKPGAVLQKDDRIGHPSCEGGIATGTHLHIARKYNGEWILADGPIPFTLGGWSTHNGDAPYKGTLTRGDTTIVASTSGSFATRIIREP
jgi:murein DD-endopeptidase MepM/ murein hydrolase activator NlpD